MSSGMRTHEHAFFVSGVTRVAGLCPLDRVKRDFLVVSASKAMLVVTVSIGGSLHGHYNHWRGLGKAGVFDVRGGCHRADPETPDAQARRFSIWLAQRPAGTVVAMEACSGAHHWARRCLEYGLVPRLMAAQFVRPFRKNPLAKNDPNDAEAIATAARQPD